MSTNNPTPALTQQEFDAAYWAAQPRAVQALPGIIDQGQRYTLASQLVQQGYIIDSTVMVWGWSAWYTAQMRMNLGYTWVPSAGMKPIQTLPGITNSGTPPYDAAVVPPGGILVTLDVSLLPLIFPAPAVAPAS